eukprot:comp19959_c0_seq1/m.24320 comp19959_c0_seq1/g.24320  ORF comp19959_c0_seq1/g.24320 comp19959_c0_seq1/m.24320 type:complete len:566 (-) comp19959_c0_seq1:75-1772(-)
MGRGTTEHTKMQGGWSEGDTLKKLKDLPWYRKPKTVIIAGVLVLLAFVVILCVSLAAAGVFSNGESGSLQKSGTNDIVDLDNPSGTSRSSPATTTTSAPVIKLKPGDAGYVWPTVKDNCECAGLLVENTCYGGNMTAALLVNPSVIKVAGVANITKGEHKINRTLTIQGVTCQNKTAVFLANLLPTTKSATIFRVVDGVRIDVNILNVTFRRNETSGQVSLLRVPEVDAQAKLTDDEVSTYPVVSLNISRCSFENFYTKTAGGAVIYLAVTNNVNVEYSTFVNNTVKPSEEIYGGSGAIWIFITSKKGKILFRKSKFLRNQHLFPHGLGGAIGISSTSGDTEFDTCTFRENTAPGGGAYYTNLVEWSSHLNFHDCIFENNIATDPAGWGSRGGAIWVQATDGETYIHGSFIGNECPSERGGAIASNKIHNNGKFTISGYFEANTCKLDGAVFSLTMHGFLTGAQFRVDQDSTFVDNKNSYGDVAISLQTLGEVNNVLQYSNGDCPGLEMTGPEPQLKEPKPPKVSGDGIILNGTKSDPTQTGTPSAPVVGVVKLPVVVGHPNART